LTTREQKAELRHHYRAALAAEPADRLREQSARVCEHLRAAPCWQSARTILLFAPLPSEVDVWPLVPEALAARKTVALPRRLDSGDEYGAAAISSPATDCRPGAFGIQEPRPDLPAVPLNRLDLVLVPGLAFDRGGRRLGRGKGFYDRLLARVSGIRCGVAFEFQVAGEIPAEPHDVSLDCIVTPAQWVVVRTPPGFR
jgi:5-formyltetrahydrofolate cyclo-ligase